MKTLFLILNTHKAAALNLVLGCLFLSSVASAQCTNGTGNPSAFTPNYSGNNENISNVGSGGNGHYALVNILPNKYYTFVSSLRNQVSMGYVGYITITNQDGSLVLASGTAPLFWESNSNTGTIRYYVHNSANCSTTTVPYYYSVVSYNTFCEAPTGLTTTNITNTSATLNWTEPPSTPGNGYQYYISEDSTPPMNYDSTAPTGYSLTNSKTINNLDQNTTYYWWVRSSCGTQGSIWIRSSSFTTAATVCNQPSNPSVSAITGTSALLSWTASSPTPVNGYEYAFNTTGNNPTTSFDTTGTSVSLVVLQPSITYYWFVRSNCGFNIVSPWLFGGSFTTLNGSFCNVATYGVYPTVTYTPSCTGSAENIATDAYAGEYSNVAISINTQYTFSSSVSTDYITITNQSGDTLLANGTTPLTWNSTTNSGTIRYYFHTSSACGSENIERTRAITCTTPSSCSALTSLNATNITSNSALITWTASSSSGASYDVYFGTSSTAPTASTTPTGNVTTTSALLNNLLSATNYYYWVRSHCSTSNSAWVAGGFLTTIASLNCNGALYGLYPAATFTPACTGTNETIVADAYAGEYANVAINTNTQYTFSSSVATDFITITNQNGTAVLTSGISPLVWSSATNSGTVRYYLHSNTSCGNQAVSRNRLIRCSATVGCGTPANLVKTNITSNSGQVTWTASATSGATYDVYFSATSTAPTSGTTPSGNVSTLSAILNNLMSSTIYFVWVRANCGATTSSWVSGGTFTTNPNLSCNGAVYGLYPTATFTPSCSGTDTIVTDAYAGEFSKVAVVTNKQYTFSSSVATDYVTITNDAGNSILANGPTPLVWLSGANSGEVRYFLHSNSSCGTQNQNRIRSVACAAVLDNPAFETKTVQVYPNPAIDFLTITATALIDTIEMSSCLGQVIQTIKPLATEAKIDLKGLSPGLYFVKITMGTSSSSYKIIKN